MIPKPNKNRDMPLPLSAILPDLKTGRTGQKNPENDTEMIQNYRRYRHTSGNGRKERIHAKNEQETAAGMVFFPAASESREYHLRPYHIQRPLPGLHPRLQAEFPSRDYPLPPVLLQALETKGGHRLWQITANITTSN